MPWMMKRYPVFYISFLPSLGRILLALPTAYEPHSLANNRRKLHTDHHATPETKFSQLSARALSLGRAYLRIGKALGRI